MIILEKFRLRKLKGSAKTDAENKLLPNLSNSDVQTEVSSENDKSCGTAEVVSSFQKLGLREEVIRAVDQCVGVPEVLDDNSVVLSSGRTLAWLLPLVQPIFWKPNVLLWQKGRDCFGSRSGQP
ncbi:hypothetical protein Dsin_016925 [Dipteronia sinensis]|uniref:Uncharacterized protein n=1 Tax=Dipteronia sinensis TaxID=43782 RepID=A0AAE0AEB5_9ROSI|nr:hypothetical protein Dsin_016925 [Dipteronia sinensis]